MAKKPTIKKQEQQPPTPPKRRVPLGKAIRHTDQELETLAQVTDADKEAAAALWRASAGKLANLLDAKPEETQE